MIPFEVHPDELWPAEDGEPGDLLRREARLAEPPPVAVLRVGYLAPDSTTFQLTAALFSCSTSQTM